MRFGIGLGFNTRVRPSAPVPGVFKDVTAATFTTSISMTATPRLWTLSDEANLVLDINMLDATAFTTGDSGTTVASVTNKVSSVVASEATNRPAYNATGLSGKPCMDFDGVNDRMIVGNGADTAAVAALAGTTAFTLFMVIQPDVADVASSVCTFGVANSAAGTGRRNFGQSSSSTGRWLDQSVNDASTTVTITSSTVIPSTSPLVYEYHSDGSGNVALLINGTAVTLSAATHAPGTMSSNRWGIGCQPSSSIGSFFDGKVGQIALYSVQKNSTARDKIRKFLGGRWGITVA